MAKEHGLSTLLNLARKNPIIAKHVTVWTEDQDLSWEECLINCIVDLANANRAFVIRQQGQQAELEAFDLKDD